MPIDPHDEYRAALAFRHTPGIGVRTAKRLLDAFGSLAEAARRADAWGDLGLVSREPAVSFRARIWKEKAEREYMAAREAGMRVLSWCDERYPKRLLEIHDPPLFLYVLGRVSLLRSPGVAIVGARQCSSYGLSLARAVGEELSSAGVTIISGLASGIDRQAHQAGLSGIGSSIAVLGTGLDRVYPAANADIWKILSQEGCIVSEFAPGSRPESKNFPIRNRIISGIALGVLVVEAAAKSGSLITARLAMEQGREVFAFPGPLTQPTFTGCHSLIREGAMLISSADDILVELRHHLESEVRRLSKDSPEEREHRRPHASDPGRARFTEATTTSRLVLERDEAPLDPGAFAPDLSSDEQGLLHELSGADRLHIDLLGRALDMESPRVSRMLLELEIKGLVRQWPGMYYSLA